MFTGDTFRNGENVDRSGKDRAERSTQMSHLPLESQNSLIQTVTRPLPTFHRFAAMVGWGGGGN
jgi:hypothetical protein